MKAFLAISLAAALKLGYHGSSAASNVFNLRGPPFQDQTLPCTMLLKEIHREIPDPSLPDFAWDCELDPQDADGVEGIIMELDGLNLPRDAKDNFGQRLISGESTVFVPGTKIDKGKAKAKVPPGVPPAYGRRRREAAQGGRRLRTGNWTVFAVRVIATDGSTSSSTAAISNFVFGTSGDQVNLKSQYAACSHNQLMFEPAPFATDGVIEVTVNVATTEGDGVMRNAITSAIQNQYGLSPNSLANYAMYCLPSGTMSGIAYAYINSWNSVYSNQWCNYVSAQMHELGHNINLAHSGEGSQQYADQSGMMGYSYSSSETPKMCFNAAKMWQLGWFSDRHVAINPLTAGWTGDMIGSVDYENSASDKMIVLKINRTATSEDDLFVMFNRKASYNSDTKEGGNQVMIVETGREGLLYDKSLLVAKLSAGGQYVIPNFDGSGTDVTVTVNSINLSSTPAIASVTVQGFTASPTESPTPSPTDSPTPSPPPTDSPTGSPSSSPSAAPSSPPTPSPPPTSSPTGSPSSSPSAAPSSPPTPSPPPTASPSESPSSSPSATPTSVPTPSPPPTASPSDSPTSSPTKGPTPTPTRSPTPSPTPAPVAVNCAPLRGGTCRDAGCQWLGGQGGCVPSN